LEVNSASTVSIDLQWDAVSEASGYNVYRSNSENGAYTKINAVTITATGYTDTAVSPYSIYYYKVSAIISSIERELSISVSASSGVLVLGSSLEEKLTWLQSNAVSNTVYGIEVTANESIGSKTLYYSGRTGITIILNSNEIMRTISFSGTDSLFIISSGVTLILENNIVLNGSISNNATSLVMISGGIFIMNGGKILDNTGRGVYINYGTFTMNGGEIFGNSGGVRVSYNGTFTMNGGEISGNIANGGGGLYIVGGTFTMNNGKISGNTRDIGGGIYLYSGSFTMKGGEISGNTSTGIGTLDGGGGVYASFLDSPVFRISGGVIYGNNASMELRNTANGRGASLYYSDFNGGAAQYGTFDGDTFRRSGYINTTDDTIRVVNGNLVTY
jgi:hypothetical protein